MLETMFKGLKKHRVELSNGEAVILIESTRALSIARSDEQGDVDYVICSIESEGVLTYPNSNDAPRTLVEGLQSFGPASQGD